MWALYGSARRHIKYNVWMAPTDLLAWPAQRKQRVHQRAREAVRQELLRKPNKTTTFLCAEGQGRQHLGEALQKVQGWLRHPCIHGHVVHHG